jgi:hypothetical protein
MGQGKEAATVRRALLVIVLIASSFLGGAFVNGPGLQWVQSRLVRYIGLNGEGEIAAVDLLAPATPDASGQGSSQSKPVAEPMAEPLAPMPSVIGEDESPKRGSSGQHAGSAAPSEHAARNRNRELPETRPSSLSSSSAGAPPVSNSSASRSQQAASPDSQVKPAGAAAPDGLISSDPKVKPALLDSLAGLLPAVPSSPSSPPSGSPSSSHTPASNSLRNAGEDWAALQRKLQALSVSRFTIEGEPGGRVVFSCLIPLAGHRAVAQRFEAEGDDVAAAMQATLRRIALWRATQSESH